MNGWPIRRTLMLLAIVAFAHDSALAKVEAPAPHAADHAPAPDLAMSIITLLGQVPERSRHFHETREVAALKGAQMSSGILLFRRPSFLQKTTQTPHLEEMTIDGDVITLRRCTGEEHLITLADDPALQILSTTLRAPLVGDVAALKRYYRLQATGDAGSWTLVMTPAGEDTARLVREVTLTGRNNVIESLRIARANGDVQTLTIDP